MKLTRIVKICVNLSRVNFVELIFALLISSILTPILGPVQTFLTPKKHYLQAFFLSIYPFIFHLSPKLRGKFTIFVKFVSSYHQPFLNRVDILYYKILPPLSR